MDGLGRKRVSAWLVVCALIGLSGGVLTPVGAEEDPPHTYAGKDVHWWIAQLDDHETVPAAHVAFRKIGAAAVEPLVALLRHPDRMRRYRAVMALRKSRLDLSTHVVQVLDSMEGVPIAELRGMLELLRDRVKSLGAHVDRLVPMLMSHDPHVLSVVAGMLAREGSAASSASPALRAILERGGVKTSTVDAVIRALASVAPAEDATLQALRSAWRVADDLRRHRLLATLQKLPMDAPVVRAWVLEAAKDPTAMVRSQAKGLLVDAARQDPEALEVLLQGLEDPDRKVRLASVHAISRVGSRARAALPRLLDLLELPESEMRSLVLGALTSLEADPQEVLPRLMPLLARHPPSSKVQQAVRRFFHCSPASMVEGLASDVPWVWTTAWLALDGWGRERWESVRADLTPVLTRRGQEGFPKEYKTVRILASWVVLAADHADVQDCLLVWARKGAPDVKPVALQALGANPAHMPLVAELFVSGDAAERAMAREAIQAAQHQSAHWSAAIAGWLRNPRPEVHEAAAHLHCDRPAHLDLALLSSAARARLAHVAAERLSTDTSDAPARVLGGLGAEAVPHVPALIASLGRRFERGSASGFAWALPRIAHLDMKTRDDIVKRLLPVLDAEAPLRAAHAALALHAMPLAPGSQPRRLHTPARRMIVHDGRILDTLRRLLPDGDAQVRYAVLDVARSMKGRARPLVPDLVRLLEDPDEVDARKYNLAHAVAAVEPENPRFLRAVVQMLPHPDYGNLRANTLPILQRAGATVVPIVVEALPDAVPAIQRDLLGVLQRIGASSEAMRAVVEPLTRSPDAGVAAAAKALLANPAEK